MSRGRAAAGRRSRLRIEELEVRQLLSGYAPTAAEQLPHYRATSDILTMTCSTSCAVSTTGSRADGSARSARSHFPIIGVTLRPKLLTLHDPRQIFLQELLTRNKRNIKLAGQSNLLING